MLQADAVKIIKPHNFQPNFLFIEKKLITYTSNKLKNTN